MKVAISHLRRLMSQTCVRAGIPADRIDLVVAHYLDGELRGKPSHGVAKFCFESQFFAQRAGSPRIVREYGALAVVDAQREVGPLSADYAVDLAVARARAHGAGIIGMINTQRYGILASWPERMAEHGMVGIAMNTSRAEATVSGGRTAVLGVNPLAFAFPTTDGSVSADMSTTLAPMGVLWEARRAGTRLPDGCFVDVHGEPTNDPEAAQTAVVFGGHRGFALSLLVQVLTGSLFGFPMGHEVSDTWSTGYMFIALDPSLGGQYTGHAQANTLLAQALTQGVMRNGENIRLPGEAGKDRAVRLLRHGSVDLDPAVHDRLRVRAAGDFTTD